MSVYNSDYSIHGVQSVKIETRLKMQNGDPYRVTTLKVVVQPRNEDNPDTTYESWITLFSDGEAEIIPTH